MPVMAVAGPCDLLELEVGIAIVISSVVDPVVIADYLQGFGHDLRTKPNRIHAHHQRNVRLSIFPIPRSQEKACTYFKAKE